MHCSTTVRRGRGVTEFLDIAVKSSGEDDDGEMKNEMKDRIERANGMSFQTAAAGSETASQFAKELPLAAGPTIGGRHRAFWATWYAINFLFLASLFTLAYTGVWEYSTRRYVKGSADAIIPASASSEEAVQAILDWMAHGPAQISTAFTGSSPDRDPVDTLNYTALLKVCGTATNAFVNLAASHGLSVRRLLLLGPDSGAKHVDAEVLVNGRWIVVDPAFRTILRTPDGKTLTRDELATPAIFAAATGNIPRYDPSYNFERTAHVRARRLGFMGASVQKALDFLVPGWDSSVAVSLVLERQSLAAMVFTILILLSFAILRFSLRWYAEAHLHIQPVRVRQRLLDAHRAFLNPAG